MKNALAAVLVLAVSSGLGCASRGEPGPFFSADGARAAGPGRALLYVFRTDAVRASGSARVRLGDTKATLRNAEYLWLEVPAGRHELSLQFRGLPWSWGWDTLPFEARSGAVLFLRLEARTVRTQQRAALPSEDPRPGDEQFGIQLLPSFIDASNALPELRKCRLSPDLVEGG